MREVKKLEKKNREFRWTVLYVTSDTGTDVTLALVMGPLAEDAANVVHVLSDESEPYRTLHDHAVVVDELVERFTKQLNPEPHPAGEAPKAAEGGAS